jgi:16S rRNA (guanine966-N2)-methyltransferase
LVPNKNKRSAKSASGANRVRIIGGVFRSRLLSFPPALQVRPTPDRVRETLFNWLGQDLTGKSCLDLFAGSGALGFEALSRGAASVVMVEKDRRVFTALEENRLLLHASACRLLCRDALEFLRVDTLSYDIIFLDPPYTLDRIEELFALLESRLAVDGLVYREGPSFLPDWGRWIVLRSARAGAVHYQLLKRMTEKHNG